VAATEQHGRLFDLGETCQGLGLSGGQVSIDTLSYGKEGAAQYLHGTLIATAATEQGGL
jgi:hypothetical protein